LFNENVVLPIVAETEAPVTGTPFWVTTTLSEIGLLLPFGLLNPTIETVSGIGVGVFVVATVGVGDAVWVGVALASGVLVGAVSPIVTPDVHGWLLP
jgi:hypothetical protein